MDHGFFHADWWQLIPLLVLWLAVSSELERAWGAYRLVFLYVVIAPISASLLLIARSGYPGFGLVPLLMGAAGALNAIQPSQRLHWGLWYIRPWFISWRRCSSGLFSAVALWLVYEVGRIVFVEQQLMPVLLSLSVMFLSASTSYLLASVLFAKQRENALGIVREIAEGRRPLDELEGALPRNKIISLEVMAELTQRIIHEGRRDIAQVLSTYLALREPNHPSALVLRRYLKSDDAQHDSPSD